MPIKVTYTDDKGNPLPPPDSEEVTTTDRNRWEDMQAAAYQRGIYEDELDTPKGAALLEEFNIPPEKIPAIRADIAKKAQEQEVPGALPQVAQGFTSEYKYEDATPRQRYVHYAAQQEGKPAEEFGTNMAEYIDWNERQKEKEDQDWRGFGDPTKDVNYKAPGTLSGFDAVPGVAASTTPITPNPGFPTRDEATGRVTPAVTPQPQEEETVLNDDDDAR